MKSTKPIVKIAIILAVVVIPLAYSLFYLGAFWDPYGKLTQLPVAVVNEDNGAVINGKTRNLGTELVEELKRDNSVKWTETDASDASAGLNGTQYYAVVTIPNYFSSDVASAETTDKHVAQITYSANEKRNFLAAQILNRAVIQIEEKLQTKVDEEITAQLTEKLQDVPTKLQDLNNGIDDMSDGTLKLSDGLNDLSKGQSDLTAGALTLDNGLSKLVDGSKVLSDNLQKLHSGIALTKSSVSGALSSMSGISGQSASLNDNLHQLVAGAKQVSDGLSLASTGASQLSAAASSKTSGLPALVSGIDQADTGAAKISAGVGNYVDGVNSLLTSDKTVMTKLSTICTSTQMTDAQKVAAVGQVLAAVSSAENQTKLQTLDQSGTMLKTGAAALAAGVDKLKASEESLNDLNNNLTTLSTSLAQLSGGASQVSGGVSQLATKASSLAGISDSLSTLTTALDKLDSGSQQLYAGSQTLTAGLESAKTGSSILVDGSGKLQDGTAKLQDGIKTLSDGITTAKTGVNDSITKAQSDLKATDGLSTFADKPLEIKESPINPVPNYGTAFAPYFISLSLYVGALIMFVGIYLDQDKKIWMLSRDSGRRFVRVGAFAGIGIIQALALALIVRYGLGVQLAHPAVFYLSCVLASFVFISIVQFFMVCLNDIGKFLAMILLILQLTANGGTFPMELVPKFFNVIYPYMPMTYSVRLFKETISGGNMKSATTAAVVLIVIGACFTALTMLFSARRRIKEKRVSATLEAEPAD